MSIEIVRDAPKVALAIYAHPDDAEISCGATLAAWSAAGARVELAIITLGDKGAAEQGVDVEELIRRRRKEVEASAAVLGLVSVAELARRDGEFDNDVALRGELVALIRRIRPDVVVCPDPTAVFFGDHYFNHRDHREAGWAALEAVSPAAASPLYFPETGEPHAVATVFCSGTLEANVAVDVAETIEAKAEAVLCHQSQLGSEPDWLRAVVYERAADAGRAVGRPYVESFRRIRLDR